MRRTKATLVEAEDPNCALRWKGGPGAPDRTEQFGGGCQKEEMLDKRSDALERKEEVLQQTRKSSSGRRR